MRNFKVISDNFSEYKRDLKRLTKSIFQEDHSEKILLRLSTKSQATLVLAINGERIVGFKAGYEESPGIYYSWMGGVLQKHRGKGYASRLMKLQHQWCQDAGFKSVRTKTLSKWESMLALNRRFGFQVIGYEPCEKGSEKIVMEKQLFGSLESK